MNKKEITDAIVQMTEEYTDHFFQAFPKKKMDKQIWAALHCGFMAAMKLNGYNEEKLAGALDDAQAEIARWDL